MNDIFKDIGNNIRQLRNDKSLTQEELAEKSGISALYLSQVERGSRNPSMYVLSNIAKSLNIDLQKMLFKKK